VFQDSPVRSSTSENLGALHMLQVWRRAQFTLAHLLHCQSSALNKPRDLSAAALPISVPSFFLLELLLLLLLPLPRSRSLSLSRSGLSLPSRSRSHLLHCNRRAKFRWRQLQNRAKGETRRTPRPVRPSLHLYGHSLVIWANPIARRSDASSAAASCAARCHAPVRSGHGWALAETSAKG